MKGFYYVGLFNAIAIVKWSLVSLFAALIFYKVFRFKYLIKLLKQMTFELKRLNDYNEGKEK